MSVIVSTQKWNMGSGLKEQLIHMSRRYIIILEDTGITRTRSGVIERGGCQVNIDSIFRAGLQ